MHEVGADFYFRLNLATAQTKYKTVHLVPKLLGTNSTKSTIFVVLLCNSTTFSTAGVPRLGNGSPCLFTGFIFTSPDLPCASMGVQELYQYFHKLAGNVCLQWTVPHPARPDNQFKQVLFWLRVVFCCCCAAAAVLLLLCSKLSQLR